MKLCDPTRKTCNNESGGYIIFKRSAYRLTVKNYILNKYSFRISSKIQDCVTSYAYIKKVY